jgi:hypothetical protein
MNVLGIPVHGDVSVWTTSLTEHFVGSYKYVVTPIRPGLAEFRIDDSKSAWSLFLHQVPSWRRTHIPFFVQPPTPLGTTYQVYWWREAVGW